MAGGTYLGSAEPRWPRDCVLKGNSDGTGGGRPSLQTERRVSDAPTAEGEGGEVCRNIDKVMRTKGHPITQTITELYVGHKRLARNGEGRRRCGQCLLGGPDILEEGCAVPAPQRLYQGVFQSRDRGRRGRPNAETVTGIVEVLAPQ